jgi:hypothetical protein
MVMAPLVMSKMFESHKATAAERSGVPESRDRATYDSRSRHAAPRSAACGLHVRTDLRVREPIVEMRRVRLRGRREPHVPEQFVERGCPDCYRLVCTPIGRLTDFDEPGRRLSQNGGTCSKATLTPGHNVCELRCGHRKGHWKRVDDMLLIAATRAWISKDPSS